ncbi:MAG: M24 family metallopeptidase [Alphaproteobacteria bacterium]|nr:M24 family metallopeptidase [Alphaproteobacteria bacterium]
MSEKKPGTSDYAARLQALRAVLAEGGLDGFIVPMTDEYMNEYVPPSARRIEFMTGFTGSAGMLIVMKQKAAFFTDGRYTLQAARQLPHGLFEQHDSLQTPPSDWIRQNLKEGNKLGYDPWLHTAATVERYRMAAVKADAYLAATEKNPVDAIWKDRPPPTAAPIAVHPQQFAGVAPAEKRSMLAAEMERGRLAAAVITDPASVAWLLNVRGADVPHTPLPLSFAILHRDASVDWFVSPRKLADGVNTALGAEVRINAPESFAAKLDELGAQKAAVRIDPQGSASWIVERLRAAGARIDRGPDLCELPRACKNETEIAGMRAAHRRDGAALCKFLHWIDTNAAAGQISELDAEKTLLDFRANGEHFRGTSFDTISGAGPNGAIVHYRTTAETARKLEPGTLYLVDSGGQYLDGTTDVTRTVFIAAPGDEPGEEMRDRFTRVLKGHIALAAIRFPVGTVGQELDALARQYLWATGVDYNHGTGHGVGCYLGVHEGPQNIARRIGREVTPLRPGMVLSNEPGYYKAGHYGIRIENLQLVTGPETLAGGELPVLGFEPLTLAPIDRRLIALGMLTRAEKEWLNAYHRQVFEAIGPQLEGDAAKWLAAATAAI